MYLVVSRDFLDKCTLHCCSNNKDGAMSVYDCVSDRVAGYNAVCRDSGKKQDVVELLMVGDDFRSDGGCPLFTGFGQEGVRVLLNNVRDEDSADARSGFKSRGAFFRPVPVSDELSLFFGRTPKTTLLSRHEASRLINEYVKKHDLTDKSDSRFVFPDERMRDLLLLPEHNRMPQKEKARVYGDPRVSVFDLHRGLIAHHFLNPETRSLPPSSRS